MTPAKPDPEPAATDDVKAKFRAALDRKRGNTGTGATPHAPDNSVVPHSNDKRTRQFRRKSGG